MQKNIPSHVAIIPDGNRRWAKKRSLKPWLGHKQGFESLIQGLEAAIHAGVSYITFWGASIDNLQKRNKLETRFFLEIIKSELSKPSMLAFLHKHQVQVKVLGQWLKVLKDTDLKTLLRNLEEETKTYHNTFLTILFAYDGKLEMLDAIHSVLQTKENISEKTLRKSLLTGNLPDVDLVIRTGGQPHWSAGFMMWLTANSEFYFTETLWPDFSTAEFHKALEDFANRSRKMGA